MTKKEIKEKVKKFRKDHEVGIAYWKGVTVSIIGFAISEKLLCGKGKRYNVKNKNMQEVLDDIIKCGCPGNLYTGITNPIKIADMGKLGEDIMKHGGNGNHELSHFIMVGKENY